MTELKPPDSHFLSAAEGWLELGDVPEARAELDLIQAGFREHPEVLKVRWAICAQEKDWLAALHVGRRLVGLSPEEPFGWLHQAYALRRAPEGGLKAAWDSLFPALEKFPDIPIIPYNLACYACQLGQWDQARELLKRALTIGDGRHIREIALQDPDLQPLWTEIPEL
jgi:tetratricopeptide (TPR) repeat protein